MGAALAAQEREPMAVEDLVVGIDAGPEDPIAADLAVALADRGVRVLTPPDGLRGAEAHVTLARLGAQLLLGLPPVEEAPLGFAVVPVVAIGRDSDLHRALADDFDLILGGEPAAEAAALVFERLIAHANGEPTAAERRGARDFVLHRLAVTM
jgi:altronate dehydratase